MLYFLIFIFLLLIFYLESLIVAIGLFYKAGFVYLSPLILIMNLRLSYIVTILSVLALDLFLIRIALGLLAEQRNKAKFANIRDLKRAGLNFQTGIILGRMGGILSRNIMSNKSLSVLIIAPPGTGKTRGFIIPNLKLCKNSMLVYDPKGELYENTYTVRKNKLGHEILLFDPAGDKTICFNVFDNKLLNNQNNIKAYLQNIASILIANQNPENQYFVRSARQVFVFFALWYLYDTKGTGELTSLAKLRNLILSYSDDLATNMKLMLEDEDLPEDIRLEGREALVAESSERQWAGIYGTLMDGLQIFSDPYVAAATSGESQFSAESLRNKRQSIYLKVRDIDRDRLIPLFSLIFSTITRQLISRMPNNLDNDVTFILDEFIRLGKVPDLIDLPSISRGYRVNSIFVIQDYDQIAKTYSKEDIGIMESNCAYKIILRQNNMLTAERISHQIGLKSKKDSNISKSYSPGNLFIKNINKSPTEKEVRLITAQQIMNMNFGKAILICEGMAERPAIMKCC